MLSTTDLIVAPATANQSAARAIIRLTGAGLSDLLGKMFTSGAGCDLALPAVGESPRHVAARLRCPGLGRDWGELPVALMFWPGPAGPLGTAVAEVQLPGSPPLMTAVVAESCRLGARLARGGEFSLRSFLAGKIDLLQAEAVVSVIDARTPEELSRALDRMAGGLGRSLEEVRDRLLDLVADIEAAIDFADDVAPDAVPVAETTAEVLLPEVNRIHKEVLTFEDCLASRDASAQGGLPRVVLAGLPNIGKSSLFNGLLSREAALVEDQTGTTRDWIGGELCDAAGAAVCLLVDLAGLTASAAPVGSPPTEGTVAAVVAAADRVSREVIRQADLVVVCQDATAAEKVAVPVPIGVSRIDVLTRADRLPASAAVPPEWLLTSAETGEGIASLRQCLLEAVAALPPSTPATLRMSGGLSAARQAVEQAQRLLSGSESPLADEALLAVVLRQAIDALGEVTGAVIGTDIIDRVFSRHCIGK